MEKDIEGVLYRTGKLDARAQFHVMRRVAPLFAKLSGGVKELTPENLVQTVASGLSEMPEQDVDYILNKCLSVVSRKDSTAWARVTDSNGRLMYDDISMAAIMNLALAVIQENLSSFFSNLVRPSQSGEPDKT